MKRKLLVLAIAGAFVAPAAMAETANVNVYGQLNMSYDSVSNNTVTNSARTNHISSNASRIGFKGQEDLGSGMSAVFQIEQLLSMDGFSGAAAGAGTGNTAAGFAGPRNHYVGLSGESWGSITAGYYDTPYKAATRSLDMFYDSAADNRSLMGLAGALDTRLNNLVTYTSPTISGFSASVATAAGAETATGVSPTKGTVWSLSGNYGANVGPGALKVVAAYNTITFGSANSGNLGVATFGPAYINPPAVTAAAHAVGPNDKVTAFKLGGSYAMDMFQVNAVYEKISSSGTALGKGLEENVIYLAGKYNISANDGVKLAYTKAGKIASVSNTDASQFSVGYDHNLSKRTSVYALYTKLSNKSGAAYTFGGNQVSSVTGAPSAADADPAVVSIGMKHAF